jgi:hypothetical protein
VFGVIGIIGESVIWTLMSQGVLPFLFLADPLNTPTATVKNAVNAVATSVIKSVAPSVPPTVPKMQYFPNRTMSIGNVHPLDMTRTSVQKRRPINNVTIPMEAINDGRHPFFLLAGSGSGQFIGEPMLLIPCFCTSAGCPSGGWPSSVIV